MREANEEEYLYSFWIREVVINKKRSHFPAADDLKGELLRSSFPYKFPYHGRRAIHWQIREIETLADLEELWMHKSDTWLEDRGLWGGSNYLRDIAELARTTRFFESKGNDGTGQMKNYRVWRGTRLQGVLAGYQRPMLVEENGHIDILDGFGRLLPYLYHVKYEGKEWFPFEAYFAS